MLRTGLNTSSTPKTQQNPHTGCRICYKYFDKYGPSQNYFPAVAKKEGVLKTSYERNRAMISEHSKGIAHTTIIQKLQKTKERNLDKEFENIQVYKHLRNFN